MTVNYEMDYQDSIRDEDNPSHDEQQEEQNRIYDELYYAQCEATDTDIREAKKGTFERFRDRFINWMDKLLTKIN